MLPIARFLLLAFDNEIILNFNESARGQHGNQRSDRIVWGINLRRLTAGIAADAADAVSSVPCWKRTALARTLSASSKSIHGGLRYLEHYEFRLSAKRWQNVKCC